MEFEFYKNILAINNYRQIISLDSDLINLGNIIVEGEELKVIRLDKENIIIKGFIKKLDIGDA